MKYRGELLIHASNFRPSKRTWKEFQIMFDIDFDIQLPEMDQIEFGGLVGKVEVVDCVTQSDSHWFQGKYGIVMKNQQKIDFIPMKGRLGIFEYQHRLN